MILKTNTLLILLLFFSLQSVASKPLDVKIGILSHRGDTATSSRWAETAHYLSEQLPEHHFIVVPLDFDEIENKIKNSEIHFLLVNPSIYVVMEVRHRIRRIATLSRVMNKNNLNQFGGVLFTSKNRRDIKSLDDIKNSHLLAVDPKSLGGFQMSIKELIDYGIHTNSDLQISFAGIHDDVVKGVLNGQADIGTVRTGILESMHDAGQINIDNIKVLNKQTNEKFSQLRSTRLYPEWPFSKLPHTSDELAQSVAIALMEKPKLTHKDEGNNNLISWTIPLEYQPVHEMLQALRLAPYDQEVRFTITDALTKYWYVILSTTVFFILLAVITALVIRLNKELKTSKQRLERQHSLILESVADGIYGVDLDGNSTFANKAMEELTGWSANKLIGKNQHELLHHTRANGEQHPKNECPVYHTFNDDKPRFIEDDIFWRNDGSSFPVEYTSTPLKDENNVTIGSVVIFRDISDRKKAEKQANDFRNELAHIARVNTMGEMASGMAHELNQPLTAISTNADACIRLSETSDFDKNQLSDILEIISLQAKRAGAIIQQIRNFIRKDMPEVQAFSINDIIHEVLLLVKHSIGEHDITVQRQLVEPALIVGAQHIQIDQVILNLIKNSIDAMKDQSNLNKTLTIKTELLNDKVVCVSITDNGEGVDEKLKNHLFTPFVTSKKSGLGLGLSISESIINQHGGKLEFAGCDSQSTTFQFTLPVYEVKD